MKFKRVDEQTIRCLITEDDLIKNDLKLEDFLKDGEKARKFLNTVVEQAKEEVGYSLEGEVLAMQVIPLSPTSLVVTFSDKGADGDILSMLQSLKGDLEDPDDELFEEEFETSDMPEFSTEDVRVVDSRLKERVYEFDKLDDVISYTNALVLDKSVKSSLYKDEKSGKYYLILEKGRLSYKDYDAVCNSVSEYGKLIMRNVSQFAYIREHLECIIKTKAIDKLRLL